MLLIHMLICTSIIALVLLQQGKGADVGAAFGSGSSNTIFGSRGPASFLFKLTAILVALFFVTSVSLTYFQNQTAKAANELTLPPPVVGTNATKQQAFIPPTVSLPVSSSPKS
jgi:preprotein translocase subunit SecG